jgi:hypothetical protein
MPILSLPLAFGVATFVIGFLEKVKAGAGVSLFESRGGTARLESFALTSGAERGILVPRAGGRARSEFDSRAF